MNERRIGRRGKKRKRRRKGRGRRGMRGGKEEEGNIGREWKKIDWEGREEERKEEEIDWEEKSREGKEEYSIRYNNSNSIYNII